MRDVTVKYTGILKLSLIIGIMFILTGLAFFLGIFEIDFEYSLIGAPVNSLYGITYLTLYTFGLYLVLLALLLILPTFDRKSRKGQENFRRILIIVEIIGLVLIAYSGLVTNGILPTLGVNHTWFDFFAIGVILTLPTHLFIILSTENFQELSNFKWIWITIVSAGTILEVSSLLTYWSLLKILGLFTEYWADQSVFGIIFLFIGGLPLLLSYKQTDKRISLGLGITSLILIISGIITYLSPTLALNDIIFPLSIFKYNNYFDYLFFGSILLITGVFIASNLELYQKYIKKLSALWISLLFFGFIQFFVSILMEITDTYFVDFGLDFLFLTTTRGSLLFGMTWNVFLINGIITTLSAVIIIGSLIFKESNSTDEEQKQEEE